MVGATSVSADAAPRASSHRAVFQYHPRFGYFFRARARIWQPPADEWGALHFLATNSVGARCTHEPHERSTRAVLVIGCSLAAGDHVSNADRLTERLEARLAGVAAHNYALSGSGHDQQLLIHREFAPAIQPDVLLLCPSLACIGRNMLSERLHHDPMSGGSILVPRPHFTIEENGRLTLHNVPVPKPALVTRDDPRFDAASPTVTQRMKVAIAPFLGRRPWPAMNTSYDDPSRVVYRLGHALLAEMLRESAAPVKIVAPLPDAAYAAHPEYTNHHAFFTTLAAAGGARFVDPAAWFQGLSDDDRRACFFPHHGHYTARGHDVLAAGFASIIGAGSDRIH